MTGIASTATRERAAAPNLLDRLRARFALRSIYARELDGRIVDRRLDAETGIERPVSDHELVDRILGGHVGDRVRRTWYFEAADGTRCRYNPTFEPITPHLGVQYASACRVCGEARWNNADRPAPRLCADCRSERSRGSRCEETGLARATAYRRHGCRCPDCRAWNREHVRRWRRARRCNTSVSSKDKSTGKAGVSPGMRKSLGTNTGVTGPDGEWWTAEEFLPWLPDDLAELLLAYEDDLEDAWEREDAEQVARETPRPAPTWTASRRATGYGSRESSEAYLRANPVEAVTE